MEALWKLEETLFATRCDKFFLPPSNYNNTKTASENEFQIDFEPQNDPRYVYKTLPKKEFVFYEIKTNFSDEFILQIYNVNRSFCTSFVLIGDQDVDVVRWSNFVRYLIYGSYDDNHFLGSSLLPICEPILQTFSCHFWKTGQENWRYKTEGPSCSNR